jgi:hypothetical protein
VPQCQGALRIGIDQQARLRRLDLRGEMSSQGTLSRAAFTRCENNNVHTLASRLTPEVKMNQRADSWKKNLARFMAKPLFDSPIVF